MRPALPAPLAGLPTLARGRPQGIAPTAQAGRKEKECIVAFLELVGVTKYFGQLTAVDHITLSVDRGEFLTLLGPSGCGKTTILRMVAGFEVPSEGNILLDGDDITERSASKRPMGMVFQSYALFPHMTAEQNIAFGMKIKRLSTDEIKRRCAELLELVGLSDKGRNYPHQL